MWQLLENGKSIRTYDTHKQAKNALYHFNKMADEDMLDLYYELVKINDNKIRT